jgi:hypothetical protein
MFVALPVRRVGGGGGPIFWEVELSAMLGGYEPGWSSGWELMDEFVLRRGRFVTVDRLASGGGGGTVFL